MPRRGGDILEPPLILARDVKYNIVNNGFLGKNMRSYYTSVVILCWIALSAQT